VSIGFPIINICKTGTTLWNALYNSILFWRYKTSQEMFGSESIMSSVGSCLVFRGVSRNAKVNIVQRNNEAHSCNRSYSWRSLIITYSQCVFVALGIQHAMRMLWPSLLYNIFPHYLINSAIFGEKEIYRTQNVCFDFLYNFFLKHFSF